MTIPHVFCKTGSCHCKCQDSFCVCGFTRLHKEGLFALACVAVVPCTVPLPIPTHTNEALKQTQSPLLLYSGKCWECAWTQCIYPCHTLVTSWCCHHWLAEPKSAQCKRGLLHFIGRWALLLSIVILINSSCSEFRLSLPLMSFVGNRCLQRCKTAYSFLSEGFQKNLYCICRPSTSWGTLVIICN